MDFETLRGGVLLCGRYKLRERVPRWIGKRRFRAWDQKVTEERMLVFLDPTAAGRISSELVSRMGGERSGLLQVLSLQEFYGMHFFVVPWVDAMPLPDYVKEAGALSRTQTAKILELISSALREAQGVGLPAQRLVPGSILLTTSEREGITPQPLIFPINLMDPTEETLGRDVTAIARALLRVVPADGQVSRGTATLPLDLVDAFAEAEKQDAETAFVTLVEQLRKPVRTALPVRRKSPAELPVQVSKEREVESLSLQQERTSERSDGKRRRRRRSSSREEEKQTSLTRNTSRITAWLGALIALLVCGVTVFASYRIISPIYDPLELGHIPVREATVDKAVDSEKKGSKPSVSEELSLAIAEARSLQSFGSGQASLEAWRDILKKNPHKEEVIVGATGAIEALEEDQENIESGYRPKIIAVLEELGEMGVPAADYMLARVFWSSDTDIATAHLVKSAKEAYQPAQEWCREQGINYYVD
ncbi:MAG: hypothetical protein ACK5NG_00030 [Chthoniobacterales bacterium]